MKTLFDAYTKKVAVVMPTLKCNVACEHCILSCSPKRTETMPSDLLDRCTREFLELGFDPICLTGGEAFLFPQMIRRAADLCREYSAALVVQTNGSWAATPRTARRILEAVRGITQLGFSADYAHSQFIPREKVCNGIEGAYAVGIANVSLSVTYQRPEEGREIEAYFRQRFPKLEISCWPVTPLGRAQGNGRLRCQRDIYEWDCLPRGCEAQNTFTPIVTPEGDLHLCYHLIMLLGRSDPFFVGNLATTRVADLLYKGDTPLYRFILAYGGGSLGYLVKELCPELMEQKYQRVCGFCYEVLRRPRLVMELNRLLATREFRERTSETILNLWSRPSQLDADKPETLTLCIGKNCFKKETNAYLRQYLVNRLVDSGKYVTTKIECIDCFGLCKEAPNAALKQQGEHFPRLDLRKIDVLIEAIGRAQ